MKLISHPSFLLPWFPLTAGLPVGTYDSFINYLKLMGYRQGVDLFLFGYDWRQGVPSVPT